MESWKEWISIVVSLIALFVARRANSIAQESAEAAKASQERLEIYNHYPILAVTASLDLDTARFHIEIRNDSAINASSPIRVEWLVMAHAGNVHRVEQKGTTEFPPRLPASRGDYEISDLNTYAKWALEFMKTPPPGANSFVIRLVFKYQAVLPTSKSLCKEFFCRYEHKDGALVLVETGQ
ncbi:hypothetical protein [Achromobacter marplatensis]|uniref:hypothetical protein n=1 Tax=Achromobacter marplatensis TaxID=470868 RepID=UPI0039F70CFF